MSIIQHPLPLNTKVRATKPTCACRNAKLEIVEGTIGKVIKNQAGVWYYLTDKGITIKGDWVQYVISTP